ncbi:exosortase A [Bowmanella pacifica]
MSLIFLLWGILFFPTVMATVAIWERSETFAHCFLILPICIYLIRRNWPRLTQQKVAHNYWALLPIFGLLILWLFGSLAQLAAVEQFATFALLPMFYWLVLGNAVCRSMLFALLFWMFSVPEGEFLIPWLQDVTADITVAALRLTDIPVFRDGLYIAVPGGLFEVAVACSGIRYLIASFSLGTLFAYLTYQKWHKRLIFIAFSLLLPIVANGLRAFGIVLIAYMSDMKYATGVDHLVYGWLFFGIVIFVMFSIGNIWRDPERSDVPPQVQSTQALTFKRFTPVIPLLLLCLSAILYKHSAANLKPAGEPAFLMAFDNWNKESAKTWYPVFKNASTVRRLEEGETEVFFIFYNRNDETAEMINSLNQLYLDSVWSRVSVSAKPGYQVMEITNTLGQRRWVAHTYVTAWQQTPNTLEIKLGQALQALLGQVQAGLVVVISAPEEAYADQAEFEAAARHWFAQDLREGLHEQ